MNIAVLIKQVPVSNDVSVDPETHALVRASSEGMINPADLNAIEEAMQLKEQTDGKVVVFTMGPPDAEKSSQDGGNQHRAAQGVQMVFYPRNLRFRYPDRGDHRCDKRGKPRKAHGHIPLIQCVPDLKKPVGCLVLPALRSFTV